jgi:hypothetical protein
MEENSEPGSEHQPLAGGSSRPPLSLFGEEPKPKIDPLFWNKKEPMWELDSEQPWHKFAGFAFALGATARDVARQLGKSEPAVQNLLRQKWFQEKVTAIMAEYGARDVMDMFRAEQFNSLVTLVEMRDNPKVPAAARVACARDILDRALGKPTQRVETVAIASSEDPVAEVERLESEVNRLRQDVAPTGDSEAIS